MARLIVTGPRSGLDALSIVLSDVVAAGHLAQVELRVTDGAEMGYEVTF